MTDNFGREGWKERPTHEHKKVYQNNALRVGMVNTFSLGLQFLERLYLDMRDRQFFRLLHDVRSFERSFSAEVYDFLLSERKINLAYFFKQRVFDVLRLWKNCFKKQTYC